MNILSKLVVRQHQFSFCDNPLLLCSEICILREVCLTLTSNVSCCVLAYQTFFPKGTGLLS